MELSNFFQNDYVDFSVYDNVRKVASYIDGLKNSQRKVIYTLLETNCNSFTKVSNLGPRVQDFSQYLHGSLEGGIINMTADYVSSGNNIPYLIGDGNFGTRFIQSAAASRYIFAKANPVIDQLFKKEDNVNLQFQDFEGDRIEPKYYVPTLPLIFVNQQEGLSIGFAQKILPRDPKQLIKWVANKASGKRQTAKLTPYWNDQDFTVEQGETSNQWIIKGSFTRISSTKIRIDSLPIGYDLKGYQKVLDKLVDDKVILDYDDLSDNDKFCFEISCRRELTKHDDDYLMDKFKLIKRVSENFTCIDENNKIVQFENANEVLEAWYEKRIAFNQVRKDYIISKLKSDINDAEIIMWFIQGVIDGSIAIQNKSEKDIIASVDKHSDRIPELLRLPMRRLTSEEVKKLKDKIKSLKNQLKSTITLTLEDITLQDLESISL